jgi:3-oxoadipate enol-lactonase
MSTAARLNAGACTLAKPVKMTDPRYEIPQMEQIAGGSRDDVENSIRTAPTMTPEPVPPTSVPDEPRPPAWVPPGRMLAIPDVGELFVRDSIDRAGATKPAVLLLHGWCVTADVNFAQVYAELAKAYRVIALDHRGHGRGLRSEAPFTLEACADDAARLLEVLRVKRAVVLGYSMGGPIALLLAHRHPKMVGALVLEATAMEFHEGARERILWHGLTLAETILRHGGARGTVERLLSAAIDRTPASASQQSWVARELRKGSMREILEAGQALRSFDARPFISEIDAPAVVVVTTRDRLVAPRKQRALAAALTATVLELEDDHDVPVSVHPAFRDVTRAAVDLAAEHAGLLTLQGQRNRHLHFWNKSRLKGSEATG